MFKEYAEYKDFDHLRTRVDSLSIKLNDLQAELRAERKSKAYFQYGKAKMKDRLKREILEEMKCAQRQPIFTDRRSYNDPMYTLGRSHERRNTRRRNYDR